MSVVLITGASSGIGAAVARIAAKRGFDLALTARRLDRLERLHHECEAFGIRVLVIQADLKQSGQVEFIVQSVLDTFGEVDVLVNNAGFGRINWLENLDDEDIVGQIQVNLVAPIQLARQVLPSMIGRRKGHIINVASLVSFLGLPTYSVYAASKFGLHGFTEALRREVASYGIYVSGVYPGGVETEFAAKAGIERKTRLTTPSWMRLTPEQVAEAVVRLIDRPQRQVVLPRYMTLLIWVNRVAPAFVDWIMDRGFVRRERRL